MVRVAKSDLMGSRNMDLIKVNITGGNIIISTWCWLQLSSLASFFYLSFFSEGDDDHHHDHYCNALIPSHNVEHADEITTSDQVSEMFDENIFSPEYVFIFVSRICCGRAKGKLH